MILLVDFNRIRPDGRIAALVPEAWRLGDLGWELHRGTTVTITDGEGTEMEATIDELPEGRPYVFLVPIPGTVRDSEYRLSADQVYDFLKQVG
jgi:hypothetical protein